LHAELQRMVREACVGEVVGDLPALLPLVLEVAAASEAQDVPATSGARLFSTHSRGEESRISDREGTRVPEHVLVGDLEVIYEVVTGVLPASQPAPLPHVRDAPRIVGGNTSIVLLAVLVAKLHRYIEYVSAGRREGQFPEVEIFVELLIPCTE